MLVSISLKKIAFLFIGISLLIFTVMVSNDCSFQDIKYKELKIKTDQNKIMTNGLLQKQDEKVINEIKDLLRIYLVDIKRTNRLVNQELYSKI